MVTPGLSPRVLEMAGPRRMGGPNTNHHSLERQVLVFTTQPGRVLELGHSIYYFAPTATLNRREKVGYFGTRFPLCQQSAITLTSFVWYK